MKRKSILGKSIVLFLIVAVVSCENNVKTAKIDVVDPSDSLMCEQDSDEEVLELIEDTPLPESVDELFDDFFYTFVSNVKFQESRIKFPIEFKEEEASISLTRSDWERYNRFTTQEYYTTIYERGDIMELKKDTSVNSVSVEWIYLDDKFVEKYEFNRLEGKWMLTNIEKSSTDNTPNGSFLDFYAKFVSDSVYQRENLNIPLEYRLSSEGEDYEGEIDELTADEWFELSKEIPLPDKTLVNIEYGQSYISDNIKHLLVQGVSNSLFIIYTFRKHGEWKLVTIDN